MIVQRFNFSDRNYQDPVYKDWRIKILKRDRFRCRFPKCSIKGKKKLHVHHIRQWADYPTLRFDINNGITLCAEHHKMIKGQEEYYVKLFIYILING